MRSPRSARIRFGGIPRRHVCRRRGGGSQQGTAPGQLLLAESVGEEAGVPKPHESGRPHLPESNALVGVVIAGQILLQEGGEAVLAASNLPGCQDGIDQVGLGIGCSKSDMAVPPVVLLCPGS